MQRHQAGWAAQQGAAQHGCQVYLKEHAKPLPVLRAGVKVGDKSERVGVVVGGVGVCGCGVVGGPGGKG